MAMLIAAISSSTWTSRPPKAGRYLAIDSITGVAGVIG